MMEEEFGGDVYIYDTPDGPELDIINGVIIADGGFRTAVYLSLFGGNKDDAGEVTIDKSWWGNKLYGESVNEMMTSRFQSYIRSVSMTSKSLKIAEEKAIQDLSWLKEDGAVDGIQASIRMVEKNRIELKIVLEKAGKNIEAGNYGLQWEVMKNV